MSSCPICRVSSSKETRSRCPIAADWGDEERMAFLTSHPAPDDTNAREQILEFWSKAIAHAYDYAPGLSLELGVMAKTSMAWEGPLPPGLRLAMKSLIASQKLVRRAEIEVEKGVARRLVEMPITYLFGMFSLGSNDESLPTGQYILRETLEHAARDMVRHCRNLPEDERTFYLNFTEGPQEEESASSSSETAPWSFRQLCIAAAKSNDDSTTSSRLLGLLVGDDLASFATYLVRTKLAVAGEGVIKIAAQGAGRAPVVTAISEADRDLLRLRSTVANLQANAADLERRIQERKRDALKANREGQRRTALLQMKRMKECQSARDNRLSSLYTLEKALDQVKRLRLDKQVLEAHEAATKALKSCRETHGLSVERVEYVMEAMEEEMAEHEAIGNALGKESEWLETSDEKADLEMELEQLLQEDIREPPPPIHSFSGPRIEEDTPTVKSGDNIEGQIVRIPNSPADDAKVSMPMPLPA